MNRLLDVGFKCVGHWSFQDARIAHKLTSLMDNRNILYAFVSNGDVKYVGKTSQKLKARMYGYQNPGSSQSTNIKNNKNIRQLLEHGESVDILALPDNGLLHYGAFHLNLATGLEESIIKTIEPDWNNTGQLTKNKEESAMKKEQKWHLPSSILETQNKNHPKYKLELHKTYYNQGFFNITIEFSKYFGNDKEFIDIYLGKSEIAINGYINRSANTNKTPRIMGGSKLRDWFQENSELNDFVEVTILSPTSINLNKIG